MTDRKLTPDMHTLDHNTLDAKLYTLYSVFYKWAAASCAQRTDHYL